MRIRSPALRVALPSIRFPLTSTPLRLFRSSILTPSWDTVRIACLRDTSGSSRESWQLAFRPTANSPSLSFKSCCKYRRRKGIVRCHAQGERFLTNLPDEPIGSTRLGCPRNLLRLLIYRYLGLLARTCVFRRSIGLWRRELQIPIA